jgi:hypothetical protein
MLILAIDPGTKCGWAVFSGGIPCASGTWNLTPNRFEGAGMRGIKLRAALEQVLASFTPREGENPGPGFGLVDYEEVRRHAGTTAAHCYGGLVMMLQAWCEDWSVEYTAIPVGTMKKRATGKGGGKGSGKELVLEAARRQWPNIEIETEDQADALWIGQVATEMYGAAGTSCFSTSSEGKKREAAREQAS